MTQTNRTGMSIIGLFQNLPSDARYGEEAFEKKMEVQVFVCPQCHEVSFKYRNGL